jgi:hypothetical protein
MLPLTSWTKTLHRVTNPEVLDLKHRRHESLKILKIVFVHKFFTSFPFKMVDDTKFQDQAWMKHIQFYKNHLLFFKEERKLVYGSTNKIRNSLNLAEVGLHLTVWGAYLRLLLLLALTL